MIHESRLFYDVFEVNMGSGKVVLEDGLPVPGETLRRILPPLTPSHGTPT